MSDNVFVNRDRTKVVPPLSTDAKWQISRAEAVKLGLLKGDKEPPQTRRFDASKAHVPPQTRRKRK